MHLSMKMRILLLLLYESLLISCKTVVKISLPTNSSLNISIPNSTSTPKTSVNATPSNLLFMGYHQNYYTYDEDKLRSYQLPKPPASPVPEYFKIESAPKSLKPGGSLVSQVGGGTHGFGYFYDMETAESDIIPSIKMPDLQVNASSERGKEEKFDVIYGLNTGSAYVPTCVRSQLQTICLDDPFYPTDIVKDAIINHQADFGKLYAEVAFQSADNVCDGITRTEEEKYCSVFSQIHPISSVTSWTSNAGFTPNGGSSFDSLRTRAVQPQTGMEATNGKGYICPSVIHYARIMRAKNHRGQWRIIVNVPGYTQTLRIEECLKPLQRCQYITPKLNSACIQKWNFQRLLVWDKYNGFEMDIFRIPVACSCFIRPKNPNTLSQFFPVINNMSPPINPDVNMQPDLSSRKPPIDGKQEPNHHKDEMDFAMSASKHQNSFQFPQNRPPAPVHYSFLLPVQTVRYFKPDSFYIESADSIVS